MLALDVYLISKTFMNDVTIYTKDYCPFCVSAKSLLKMKKINFSEVNLNENPEKFEEMLTRSKGARTVPQIFYKDTYVGDCDKIHELNSQGKLENFLGL
jgi:glutaredoxin 3